METWEYYTTTLAANTERWPVPIRDDIPVGEHPKFSAYSLIPQLNIFGANGWELLSLEPVQQGRNGDLRYADTAGGQWTYTYFATFKRRTS